MTINIRQIESTNSHLRYNVNVSANEPVIEYARFGSVLVNGTVATVAIAAFFIANPDAKINSTNDAYTAINYGLRLLTQNAITNAIKKPLKTSPLADTLVRQHLPGLFPNNA